MIYDILYQTLSGAKPLRIIFDKVDEFVRSYNGIKYLALFGSEKYNSIFSRIRYLIKYESSISYVSYNYGKIKIISDDDLPFEKTLTLHNVVKLLKSVFNENHNQYY